MNHYEYIDIVGKRFSDILGVRNIQDLVSAHGDKCYAYMYGKTDFDIIPNQSINVSQMNWMSKL